MSRAYAIDANVIVRFLLRDDPKLSPKAKAILDAVQKGQLTVTCDPTQLGEVVYVLESIYGFDRTQIADSLMSIVGAAAFVMPDKARYLRALDLYATTVRHFGDACACALALSQCDGRLLSFDRKLSNVPGVTRMEEL